MKNLKTTVFLASVFSFIVISNIYSMERDKLPTNTSNISEVKEEKMSKISAFLLYISDFFGKSKSEPTELIEEYDAGDISGDNLEEIDSINSKNKLPYDEDSFNKVILYSEDKNSEKTFNDIILKKASFNDKDLFQIVLTKIDLSESTLNNVKLINATLEESNLSKTQLTYVDLTGSSLSKVDFSESAMISVIFRDIKASKSDKDNLTILNIIFKKSLMDTVMFVKSDLKNIDFSESNINSSKFNKSKLNQALFNLSTIKNSYFSNSELINCNFDRAKIISCRFYNVTFENINLRDAYLVQENDPVYFEMCTFKSVDFTGITLAGVIFDNCKIYTKGKFACKNVDSIAYATAVLFNSCMYGEEDKK